MAAEVERYEELEAKVRKEVAEAMKESNAPLPPAEEIASIVRQVITTLSGDISSADLKFYAELRELAVYIRRAKEEIADIKPKDISTNYIPKATDELDAVVGATEEATNKIMDVCDEISAVAEECPPEVKEKLIACTTRVFEACNFQDITGQRITKVVHTLKYIDSKVEALVIALGEEIAQSGIELPPEEVDEEKALLNGPQLPGNAIDQSDIDKLLGGF